MDGVTASSTPNTGLRPAFCAAFFHLTQPKVEAVSVIGAWVMPISVRRAMTSSILPTADLKLYPVLTLMLITNPPSCAVQCSILPSPGHHSRRYGPFQMPHQKVPCGDW